jgi:hypothetical protein
LPKRNLCWFNFTRSSNFHLLKVFIFLDYFGKSASVKIVVNELLETNQLDGLL